MSIKYTFFKDFAKSNLIKYIGSFQYTKDECHGYVQRLYKLENIKYKTYNVLNVKPTYPIYISPTTYIFDSLAEAISFAEKKYDPCPATGEFYGYKKAMLYQYTRSGVLYYRNPCIITLRIPEDAARTGCYYGPKCRAEFAEVVKIEMLHADTSELEEVGDDYCAVSNYDNDFYYHLGEVVRADSFDSNKEIDCTHGIHFFLTKEDALNF